MHRLEISIYERAADSGWAAVICNPTSFAKIMTWAIYPTGTVRVCVCVVGEQNKAELLLPQEPCSPNVAQLI